jgi:hypothetical protein
MNPEHQKRAQEALLASYKNASKQKIKEPKRKPKKQGESSVRDACKALLRVWGCFVWVNRTGMYSPRPSVKIPYGKVGSSDIIGCTPKGRFLCIETKYSTDQSPEQAEFQVQVQSHGGIYILAYSVDDLEARKKEILA